MKLLSKLKKKNIVGKTFLVRIDLNADFEKGKEMFRLEAVIPTFSFLIRNGAKKIVIVSHRGRPKHHTHDASLDIFAPAIAKRTEEAVDFISAYRVGALVKAVKKSDVKIVLLENIRFFSGEETNDPSFAKALAACADVYVNDAFAVNHRANASVVAITDYLPSYGGLLLEKEIKNLSAILQKPKHPFVILVGGAKIFDKINILKNLSKPADMFLLGGGAANTLFAAEGIPIGNSLVDTSVFRKITPYLSSEKVMLPLDTVMFRGAILDIGQETIARYEKIIASARTIVWSGPFGLFQKEAFSHGTEKMWRAIFKNKKAHIVVGGGETITSLRLLRSTHPVPKNIFLSTGGGAMLEYLSGKKLPGIVALEKNKKQ